MIDVDELERRKAVCRACPDLQTRDHAIAFCARQTHRPDGQYCEPWAVAALGQRLTGATEPCPHWLGVPIDTYHRREAFEARMAARRADPQVPAPCQAFYHVCCMHHWREVVTEQVDLFRAVDLVPIAGVLGTEEDAAWIRSQGIEVAFLHPDFSLWENPTLQLVWEWCHQHPAGSVLYAHSKGVSAPDDPNKPAWRRLMAHWVIKRWRHNLAKLAVADMAGVDWQHSPDYPHFSGNFWQARADWINSLPSPAEYGNRSDPDPWIAGQPWKRMHTEMWIGSRGWHHVEFLSCENTNLWSGPDVHRLLAEVEP